MLAYGERGAGKSYTMLGPASDRGIMPRAIEQLFATVRRERATYSVRATALGVYTQRVYDLSSGLQCRLRQVDSCPHTAKLGPATLISVSFQCLPSHRSTTTNARLLAQCMQHPSRGLYADGLTSRECSTKEELDRVRHAALVVDSPLDLSVNPVDLCSLTTILH